MKTKDQEIRLAFNGRAFWDSEIRGFGRHTLNLVNHLHKNYPHWKFFAYSDMPMDSSIVEKFPYVNFRVKQIRPHILWEQLYLPYRLWRDKIDIFHSTINLGVPFVRFSKLKTVLTVHDLFTENQMRTEFKKYPFNFYYKKNFFHYMISWFISLSANSIITVSDFSKKTIVDRYRFLAPKLTVVHNGVEDSFFQSVDVKILDKFKLPAKYFLYVGGYESRKNIPFLISAYKSYCSQSEQDSASLLLVGTKSTMTPGILESLDKDERIIATGYVSNDELLALYSKALCYICPSLLEGFGLQVLESMAAGAPVLLSSTSALPEIGGDAAHYFNPEEEHTLVEAMLRISSDHTWRDSLLKKGRDRCSKFRWDAIAKQTADIYSELLAP